MTEELHARADGSAWRITVNRPDRRNALTPELAGEIADAVEKGARSGAAAVLLEGAGGHFCAGLDLRWLAALGAAPPPSEIRAGLEQFQAAILAIVRAPIPVIALIRGSAAGFGVDLAVACDLRVAGSTATFTSAFARMGLVPDGGSTYGLPRLIGDGAALRFPGQRRQNRRNRVGRFALHADGGGQAELRRLRVRKRRPRPLVRTLRILRPSKRELGVAGEQVGEVSLEVVGGG